MQNEDRINAAVNRLSELTGEDFHGYRSEVWSVLHRLLRDSQQEAQAVGMLKTVMLAGDGTFWVEGVPCPHCKGAGNHRLNGESLAPVVTQCPACKRHFAVGYVPMVSIDVFRLALA